MERRGLSNVVEGALLILLVLAAIALIGYFLLKNIYESEETIDIGFINAKFSIVPGKIRLNDAVNYLRFDVRRDTNEGNVIGMNVILEDSDRKRFIHRFNISMSQLETKNISLIDSDIEYINKILIAPIIRTESGREVQLNIVDSHTITGSDIVNGNALNFNGITNNITINASILPLQNSFTITHWLKTNQSDMAQVYTIGNAYAGDGYRFGVSWGNLIFLIGNNSNNKSASNPDPATEDDTSCIQTLNDNKWHMITGVYNRNSTPSFLGYVDGVRICNVRLPSNQTLPPNNYPGMKNLAPTIGAPPCCFAYNGTIDELRIYNRSLSDDEVRTMYNNGFGLNGAKNEYGLVAGWHFDESYGNVTEDYSGNKYRGIIGGAKWIRGIVEKY